MKHTAGKSCIYRAYITALSALVLSGSVEAASKPNIVIFYSDDVGYSDIGCYGGEMQTPHINRLAKNGIRFEHFCMGISSPSGQQIITGTGGLLPQSLQDNGYTTYHAGKWLAKKKILSGFNYIADCTLANRPALPSAMHCPVTGNTPTVVADQAKMMINYHFNQTPDQGLFIYIGFPDQTDAPHPESAPRFNTLKRIYANGWKRICKDRHTHMERRGIAPPLIDLNLLEIMDHYEKMAAVAYNVEEIDTAIGQIIEQIPEQARNNTLFIFLSGNTTVQKRIESASPLHLAMGYDNGIQTPFIMSWANGIKSNPTANHGWGKVIKKKKVSAADLMPTLLTATGCDSIPGSAGKDLIALIQGGKSSIESLYSAPSRVVNTTESAISECWRSHW